MSVIAFNINEAGQRMRVWLLWDRDNCTIRLLGARELIGPDGPVGDDSHGVDAFGRDIGPNGPVVDVVGVNAGDFNAGVNN